jgi:hypothetical protein
MNQKLFLVAGALILLASGVVHGLWTNRWEQPADQTEAATKLQHISLTLGGWHGEELELDQSDLARAGYAGSLWRRYQNPQTGDTVSLLLVCGRPGPVSVHTPDACYRGLGYAPLDEPVLATFGAADPPAQFWKARFGKLSARMPGQLRIYWSWNADGQWQAPRNPRLAFARSPVLYKLYVVCEVLPGSENQETDACTRFIEVLLPEVNSKLCAEP